MSKEQFASGGVKPAVTSVVHQRVDVPDVLVKGPVVVSTMKFLEQQCSKTQMQKIMEALPAEDRKVLNGVLMATKWYPLPLLVRVMRTSRNCLGEREVDFYRKCGRASADFAVNKVYRFLFNLASPSFIAQQGSVIYSTFYSSGRLRVVEKGPNHANAELSGLERPCAEMCGRVWGWLERVLELAGAKEVRVTHPQCMSSGAPVCRFEGAWCQ